MYNSAGQFSTFVENFFPRGRLFRPSRRGPSAPSSVNEPASGPSAPPWPWQVGRCIWVLARGADVFSPVALASAIIIKIDLFVWGSLAPYFSEISPSMKHYSREKLCADFWEQMVNYVNDFTPSRHDF